MITRGYFIGQIIDELTAVSHQVKSRAGLQLFDLNRYLEDFFKDNCWDAYATEVNITWPDTQLEKQFKITDNGHGMTRGEFQHIWRTIAYNRLSSGGTTTAPPEDVQGSPRLVFGKNGKGRFASFCFASEYLITSRKNGQEPSLCHAGSHQHSQAWQTADGRGASGMSEIRGMPRNLPPQGACH